MEDIAADDDLLSDMLVDSLEHQPRLSTHKMNQAYRSPRFGEKDVISIVRHRVIIDQDVSGAVEELCRLKAVQKHLTGKSERQRHEFKYHARRYLETYLPDSGVEFALTMRYKKAALQAAQAESSRAGRANEEARERAAAADAASASRHISVKGKGRADLGSDVLGSDLCVVATKPIKAGEIIKMCKGGVKDLTRAEDEALKEEAQLGRERRKEQRYNGVLGPGRDFSIIRSSRKACSQLLLGPARFVNHDCNPNCEFYRTGQSNMMFRCLRDIGLNEEITTYYGDNYFEVDNAECMCLTCEERGQGVFAAQAEEPESGSTSVDVQLDEPEAKQKRRFPSRKPKSPPPPLQSAPSFKAPVQVAGKLVEKTFHHHRSGREDDGPDFPHTGPAFNCATCGEPSWQVADWWSAEECKRCEHHFHVFKADWPGRTPTDAEWRDKAIAGRKRLAADETRGNKSAESSLSSAASTPEAGESISLEPLTGPRQSKQSNGVDGSKNRKRSSLQPQDSNAPRKKSRLTSAEVPRKVSSKITERKRESVAPVRIADSSAFASQASDGDSDLTALSVNGGDESQRTIRASDRSSPSSMSSGSDDKPHGAKSLGKHAKTETLAEYWGAADGKRARRPVNNGLESLSSTVKRPSGGAHRRTASEQMATSTSKRALQAPVIKEEGRIDESQPQSPRHTDENASPPFLSAMKKDRPISRTVSDSRLSASVPSSPQMDPNGLATHGPERTSNSNLAKAWGADLEGGRGSRRRSAKRVGTPTLLSSPKSEHYGVQSDKQKRHSLTPPVRRKELGATDRPTPDSPSVAALGARSTTSRATSPDPTMPAIQVENVDRKISTPSSPRSNASTNGDAPLGAAPRIVKSRSSSPVVAPQTQMSKVSEQTMASPPPLVSDLQKARSPLTERSSSPAHAAVRSTPPLTDGHSPLRPFSPLAGPPPTSFASRPGIVPGQPIRKNLRWGKGGKVSSSRPLPGPGGGSSLAGPAAGFAGASPLAGPAVIKTNGSPSPAGPAVSQSNGSPSSTASASPEVLAQRMQNGNHQPKTGHDSLAPRPVPLAPPTTSHAMHGAAENAHE